MPAVPNTKLVTDFGRRSPLAQEAVAAFYLALRESDPHFSAWQVARWQAQGEPTLKSAAAIRSLAAHYPVPQAGLSPLRLLFALQTYFATVVRLVVPELNPTAGRHPFAWPIALDRPEIADLLDRLAERQRQIKPEILPEPARGVRDVFKALYQSLFPAAVRRALGEFYTPDWMAEHLLDELAYEGDPRVRVLDPACGSGTFLVAAIRRIRRWARQQPAGAIGDDELARLILGCVAGFDRQPLAVLAARANMLLAIRDLLPADASPAIPVAECDSILGTGVPAALLAQPFDLVVGNPPWQVWDQLPPDYREITKPLWQAYGLFSLSGKAARHGGGKKDLSMLMLYVAADRYLKTGGQLGFVINQTIFQTLAGEGFRRFRLGEAGAHLQVLRVNDMVRFQPFEGAANWTSTLVLRKGQPTEWPVPYVQWSLRDKPPAADGDWPAAFEKLACVAEPIDRERSHSPWRVRPLQPSAATLTAGPSDYTARLGANSGGANGVYWVRIVERQGAELLLENLAATSKSRIEQRQFLAEPDLLYPLLRWGDITRNRARPSAYLLLTQDAASRTGIPDDAMQARYPRARAYLQQFEAALKARAAYRRYQAAGPYWSMYNVGPYTLAPIKVVWRRMDRQINAAVVTPHEDPLLGPRPVIPQETCVFIEAASTDEAHYLCALLNSQPVNDLARSHSVRGGKGFGTPGMLNYLNLRRFDAANDEHLALARQSRAAHAAAIEAELPGSAAAAKRG